MRLRHIEIFNAVYSTGSISGAARLLNITQPTASKVLMHAEDQLGFLLFNRIKGKLIPTSEANIIFQESKLIDQRISSLKKTTLNLQNVMQGVVRLAVVHALGMEFLPKAITEYQKKHPKVKFEVQTHHFDSIVTSLLQHDKDVGILFNPPDQVGLTQLDYGQAEFVCIYANGEFDDHPERLKMSDLEGHPFVCIEDSGPLSNILMPHIGRLNNKNKSTIKAQTYFLARNLVAMGGGISIIDEFTARSMGAGGIKFKGFNPPLTFSVKATFLENKIPSKVCQDFITFFKESITTSVGS